MAAHSQLISCSVSEVHAMVEGAVRHGTDMEIEQNFVDSHGAGFVGFGITRLLGFDLVARFKQINKMKLYVPGRGEDFSYPLLAPALTRPIRWDIIANDSIEFGKRGELASNRKEEQELGMLCLHILQPCLGMINTLMIQDTLALPEWEDALTDVDRRGLTPLFRTNMTPYGEIQLRTDRRLDLTDLSSA